MSAQPKEHADNQIEQTISPPGADPMVTASFAAQADIPASMSYGPASKHAYTHDLPRRFGNYELLEFIARGGMGVVYKARDLRLDHIVALKMLLVGTDANEQEIQQFLNEAKAAISLNHPHILPIHDFGESEGRHYFTIPFIAGGSLQNLLVAGPLPPRMAARQVQQVSEALQYAHEHGVIHRDIKPQNVLLEHLVSAEAGRAGSTVRDASSSSQASMALDYHPRISDFGLARTRDSSLSMTGQAMGTPAYMPPEQARGQRQLVGERSDIYSLGALLYCLLTGRPPFQSADPYETMRQVCEEEPVSPRTLNPALELDLGTICLKCLRKDPGARYATARELADDLGRFLSGQPVLARPVGRLERARKWVRRNPVVASLTGCIAFVLIAGATVSVIFGIRAEEKASLATENEGKANRNATLLADKVEELELAFARSSLRPLALDLKENQPLTDPEAEALWDLAGKRRTGVGTKFVEVATASAVSSHQLRLRAALALHAAIGLNELKRNEVESLLLRRLRDPAMAGQREQHPLTAVELEQLSSQTTPVVVDVLTQAMTRSTAHDTLRSQAAGLSALAERMDRKEAALTLTKALTNTTDPTALSILAGTLSAVALRMEPKEASRLTAEAAVVLREAMTKTTDPNLLSRLTEGLSAVAARLEPKEASRLATDAAAKLSQALIKTADTGKLYSLAFGLLAVSGRMEPTKAAATLTQAMSRTADPHALGKLAEGLSAVAARLEPKEASRLASDAAAKLSQAMTSSTNTYGTSSLAKGLSAIVARMERRQP